MKLIPSLHSQVPTWLRVAVIGLLSVVTLMLVGAHFSDSYTRSIPISQDRVAQLQDEEETLNLSLEFGFDPMIVTLTRRLSADAMRKHACNCPTWRFVRTERDLTYLLLSLVQTESRGNYAAYNPAGKAYGLTQLLMSTARMYDKNVSEAELVTMPRNLTIAVAYFVDLLERFKGNYTLAVIAWNHGPNAVDHGLSSGIYLDPYARTVFAQAAVRNAK